MNWLIGIEMLDNKCSYDTETLNVVLFGLSLDITETKSASSWTSPSRQEAHLVDMHLNSVHASYENKNIQTGCTEKN